MNKKILIKLLFLFSFFYPNQNGFCSTAPKKNADSVAIYTKNGDFQKGLHYAKILSNQFLKEAKYGKLCNVIAQEATIYNLLGDNNKSLETLFKTLKTIQNRNEKFGKIILIKKIAEIYTLMKDYKNAKSNLYASLNKMKTVKNDSLLNRINQSLFKIHMLTESDSSFFYLKKINSYYKKIGDDLSYYTLYSNNFNYYIAQNNPKLAKVSIDSCVYYAKKSKEKDRILLALGNLVYNQVQIENNYKKGKETYLEIFKISDKDTTSQRMSEHYFSYGNVLQYLGDYKEANKYLRKALEIKDYLYKENISSAVRDVETKYKIEKVENQYKAKQHLLITEQLKNKKISIVIISLLLLIIILFYFLFQNTRLKQNNKLKDLHSKIQQNIINASINGQELERKKIASFLHDNISALLSSAGLHLNTFTSKNQIISQEIIKTKAILEEAHDQVRDLSHELMPTLLARFGLFYALEDLCEKNSNSVIQFNYAIVVPTKTRYNEDFEIKMYFIIMELLNNIIKHSKATQAKLTIQENNKSLQIEIEDNGKGFDTDQFYILEGFGINQIKARINNLKGTITINSKIDSGTTVAIEVPISYQKKATTPVFPSQ
jgi:signal transduction histidine kinase